MQNDTDHTPADTGDEWPPELVAAFDPVLLDAEAEALWNQFRQQAAEVRREWERLALIL